MPETKSGVYKIGDVRSLPETPFGSSYCINPMNVSCDMKTDDGGWIVIQRRDQSLNQTVNFTRPYCDYESGFGDLNGEFWYGLSNIHYLTTHSDVELRIELVIEGEEVTFTYETFRVAGPEDMYRLTIRDRNADKSTSGVRDAMANHNGQKFSTYDMDNDPSTRNCAVVMQGGWWYNNCRLANLNGPHCDGEDHVIPSLDWVVNNNNRNNVRCVSKSEMKIRKKSCFAPPPKDVC